MHSFFFFGRRNCFCNLLYMPYILLFMCQILALCCVSLGRFSIVITTFSIRLLLSRSHTTTAITHSNHSIIIINAWRFCVCCVCVLLNVRHLNYYYILVPISFPLNYFSVSFFFFFCSVCSSAWAWAGARTIWKLNDVEYKQGAHSMSHMCRTGLIWFI